MLPALVAVTVAVTRGNSAGSVPAWGTPMADLVELLGDGDVDVAVEDADVRGGTAVVDRAVGSRAAADPALFWTTPRVPVL